MIPAPRLLWLSLLGLPISAMPLLVHEALWPLVFVVWGVMLGGALFDLWALIRSKPRLRTSVPATVGVGGQLQLGCELERGGSITLLGTLRAEVEEPLRAGPDRSLRFPAGRSLTALEVQAPRRGMASVEAIWLRLQGPLGFFRRIDRFAVEAEAVRIIPNAERVRELMLAYFGSQPLGGGLKMRRRAEAGGEFDALVGYEPGMDLRQVDWKASARHHDLRVRRYRLERNQRLVLCVDSGRLMGDPIDGIQRLDHGIHAALVLAQAALRAGDLVGMSAYAAEPLQWVPPAAGVRHVARIRAACAELRARPEETNHVLGMHQLLMRLKRRSLIVLFTELTDSTTAELMIEHVGMLARRHLVIFVALDDPIVEEPLARAPSDAEDLAAALTASHLRKDRHRVLRRLERMGVNVVTGAPGQATLRLLQRYVQIKRKGLIG
ncbi:MAG: DUF58 domain-containing protein [Myxococcales bacterium]|nr:DUF58 domain-containing protein [Myxococcales bacterium]